MDNEQLDKLLRTLPRETASADLAQQVINRLEEPQTPSRTRRLAFGLTLIAALLAAGLSAYLWLDARAEKAQIRQQIAALRSEHQLLQARLRELKQKRPERPVVYLGGDDQVDYVLDLRKYLRAQVEDSPRNQIPLRYTGGSL